MVKLDNIDNKLNEIYIKIDKSRDEKENITDVYFLQKHFNYGHDINF